MLRGSPLTDFLLINASIAVLLLLFAQGHFVMVEQEVLRFFPYSQAQYISPILVAGFGGVAVGIAAAWTWRKLFGS